MLYKYLPVERIDVIENMKVRFSPLLSLNDPFEARPLINVDDIFEKSRNELISLLDEDFENIEKTEDSTRLYQKYINNIDDGIRSELDPSEQGRLLIKTLAGDYGILSLSRSNTNLLMWSHYTSSHAGYVIGFNREHAFLRRFDKDGNVVRPSPVIYTEKRSTVDFKKDGWKQKLFFEKPIEWAYEQEERLCRNIIDDEKLNVDECGMAILLDEIPVEAISSIILGYKIDDNSKKKIRDAIAKHNIDCDLYQAKLSDHEYKLELHELS
jgi:hypothetical protein